MSNINLTGVEKPSNIIIFPGTIKIKPPSEQQTDEASKLLWGIVRIMNKRWRDDKGDELNQLLDDSIDFLYEQNKKGT